MDPRHKKKPGDQLPSPSPSNGGGSSSSSHTASTNGAAPFLVTAKVYERWASAEPSLTLTNAGKPPKMTSNNTGAAKSPEPIITEPDSPMPVIKPTRYASHDGLLNGIGGRFSAGSGSNSPIVERSSHQTSSSTQSVTVQQRRQYQEIVDGPNGRQVRSDFYFYPSKFSFPSVQLKINAAFQYLITNFNSFQFNSIHFFNWEENRMKERDHSRFRHFSGTLFWESSLFACESHGKKTKSLEGSLKITQKTKFRDGFLNQRFHFLKCNLGFKRRSILTRMQLSPPLYLRSLQLMMETQSDGRKCIRS